MQELRTKRLRAGIILMIVSAVVMLVLAGFAKVNPYDYEPKSFMDKISHMRIKLWRTSDDSTRALRISPKYAFLPYSAVFAIGMIFVGIGGIITVVGLTTRE